MATQNPKDNLEEDQTSEDQLSEGNNNNSETEDTMTEKPKEEPKKKRKRRPPLVPWKKPKDMPRRPLSAYNIFFKEQREIMMNAAAASGESTAALKKKSNKSVGIGFANLARTIAANWKDLDDATRAPYEARAASEKDRYNQEMLVWRAKQKEEKERALSEQKQAADQSVAGANMDVDSDASMADKRASPIPVPLAVDDEPIPLESPKKSRLGYLEHRASHSSPFTPIRVPDLMGDGVASGEMEPVQYPPRQPGTMETIQATFSMANGPGLGMHQGYPGNPPSGLQSFHDSWPGPGPECPPDALHASAPSLPAQYLHQERRYTWSGTNNNVAGRQQAVRRNTNEKETDFGPYRRAQRSNPFPESWFEPDHHEAPPPPPRSRHSQPSSGRPYPDNWFEVQNSEGPVEPIRYSPEGDLVGKLSSRQRSKDSDHFSNSLEKVSKAGPKEDKTNDAKVGAIRSLDELVSDVTMRDFRPTQGAKRQSSGDNPIVESSLHALGMQLDEETVDFLTKLRFGVSTDHTM